MNNLIKALEQTKTRYEIHYPQSYTRWSFEKAINMYNSALQDDTKIGIEIKSGVWVWFKLTYHYDGLYLFLIERYNANIGKSTKGWRTEYKIKQQLLKLLGIDLFNTLPPME